jgi:hypothetical protein
LYSAHRITLAREPTSQDRRRCRPCTRSTRWKRVELAADSPVGGGFRLENLPPAASAGRSQISTEYANVSERLDLPRLLGSSSKLVRERRRGIGR